MSLLTLQSENKDHTFIKKLVDRTAMENPKHDDLRALHTMLKKCPEVWEESQSLVEFTIDSCINKFYDKSPAFREIARLKIEQLKADLGWQDACLLERLLISNVTLAYLRWIIIGSGFDTKLSASHTIDTGNYWAKQLNIANRHYLKSIEALTKFRQLALAYPAIKRDLTSEVLM